MIGAYLGMLFLGCAVLSIGVFASTLTDNQIVAAVLAMGVSLLLWFSAALAGYISPPVSTFLEYVSLPYHFQSLPRGVIDTKDIVYFFSVISVFLFMATRALAARRLR